MREIKFRGKRIDNGEWVYGYLIGNDVIVGDIVEFNDEYFNTEYWLKVVPETVGQYTGLKDKNGKEIYEGDIIQHIPSKGKGRVFFEKGIFKVEWPAIVSYLCDVRHNCKVIGNIHDNPELLKGEENE